MFQTSGLRQRRNMSSSVITLINDPLKYVLLQTDDKTEIKFNTNTFPVKPYVDVMIVKLLINYKFVFLSDLNFERGNEQIRIYGHALILKK